MSDVGDPPASHQVSDIAPYRWHVISNISSSLGWQWVQKSNTIDQFSRDGVVHTASWTSRALKEVTSTSGFTLENRDKDKLQKLCRALGADIRDDQKFQSLPTGNVAKLPNLSGLKHGARTGLRVFAEFGTSDIVDETPDATSADSGPADTLERGADPDGESAATLAPATELPLWDMTAPSRDTTIDSDQASLTQWLHNSDGSIANAAVSAVHIDAVPEAFVQAERIEYERTASVIVVQNEAALTARFREFLAGSHGHEVMRYKITTPYGVLYTDTADITANVVYEAKGNAERMSVRLALGQILDYGRYIADAGLAILLPEAPTADLVEMLENLKIGCVVETQKGDFVDMTSLRRCP